LGSEERDLLELVDSVYVGLEEVEKFLARIASSRCECVRGGWIYAVMDSLERVYDRLAELRSEIRGRCG